MINSIQWFDINLNPPPQGVRIIMCNRPSDEMAIGKIDGDCFRYAGVGGWEYETDLHYYLDWETSGKYYNNVTHWAYAPKLPEG